VIRIVQLFFVSDAPGQTPVRVGAPFMVRMRLMRNRWIDDGRILGQAANRGSNHQFLLLGMVSSITTSSSGGSFHSLGRGGFGGPSGINASGFGRGFPRLRARHRSFEQNQFPPFRCPGSKYIAAPQRLYAADPRSRQDLEAAEPMRPVNFEISSVDREYPSDTFTLGHSDQCCIGQVHR
jgi:hypothetical protein